MSIVIFIVILLVLVLVHEFGHFIVAKKSGIRVDEFGFGFPPKLFGVKKGETTYSFNALPFGGFVKIFGEDPNDESIKGPDSKRSFVNKPKYIQAAVLVAGVFFNLVLAWILLSAGFMSGLPSSVNGGGDISRIQNPNLTIVNVSADSPASLAGLKSGDKIKSITTSTESVDVLNIKNVQDFILTKSDQEISFSYERGGEKSSVMIVPKLNSENKAVVGISMDVIGILKLPFFQALAEGFKTTCTMTVSTAVSLFNLAKDAVFGQADFSSITGPVGIVGVVGDAYQFGFAYLISFMALISINLAVINLIPFPALDGGRLLFLLIEKIKGSPIKSTVANTVNAVGFILLILLMIFVTYHDIVKLF